MCTVVVLVAPNTAYPVQIAANRDERLDRSWDEPAEYWPGIVGGRDVLAGGTWMAINRHGVVAAVLNRPGSLGPAAGKRSRGELPLLALAQPTASAAGDALVRLDAGAWRPFNLVIADRQGALFVRGVGEGQPQSHILPAGVTMVTAYDPNEPASPRVARHLPRLIADPPDGPASWFGWRAILSDTAGHTGEQINVLPRGGFGTVCSSYVALPAAGKATWLFAAGPPHVTDYRPVRLP